MGAIQKLKSEIVMQIKVMKEVEIDAKKVKIEFCPRYMDEEDCVFNKDTPMLIGEKFSITYDIETGVVDGWPKDSPISIFEKVVDGGSYYLLDSEGKELCSIIENYVPDCVNNKFGDYLIININSDGIYENMRPAHTVSCFFDSEED